MLSDIFDGQSSRSAVLILQKNNKHLLQNPLTQQQKAFKKTHWPKKLNNNFQPIAIQMFVNHNSLLSLF